MTQEYKGPGMIKQLPACRRKYQGKNFFGGRKIPTGYIGAAVRDQIKAPWERGIQGMSEVSVRLAIGTIAIGQIRMRWNSDER